MSLPPAGGAPEVLIMGRISADRRPLQAFGGALGHGLLGGSHA